MKITEQSIEKVLTHIEQDETYFEAIQEQFFSINEEFISYLTEDIFKSLTEDEMNLLVFLVVIMNQSLGEEAKENGISMADYMDAEEENWELYEKNIKKSFRERLDPFFEQYKEEDALAFIEDSLQNDDDTEEMTISNVGRDIIWNISVAYATTVTED